MRMRNLINSATKRLAFTALALPMLTSCAPASGDGEDLVGTLTDELSAATRANIASIAIANTGHGLRPQFSGRPRLRVELHRQRWPTRVLVLGLRKVGVAGRGRGRRRADRRRGQLLLLRPEQRHPLEHAPRRRRRRVQLPGRLLGGSRRPRHAGERRRQDRDHQRRLGRPERQPGALRVDGARDRESAGLPRCRGVDPRRHRHDHQRVHLARRHLRCAAAAPASPAGGITGLPVPQSAALRERRQRRQHPSSLVGRQHPLHHHRHLGHGDGRPAGGVHPRHRSARVRARRGRLAEALVLGSVQRAAGATTGLRMRGSPAIPRRS